MTTSPKVAALEAELAVTRAQLADTVDALTDRLDPRRAVAGGRQIVRDATGSGPGATPARRTRARVVLGAGIVVVGLAVTLVVRRLR